MCQTDRGLCLLSIWRLTLCRSTIKFIKNVLAFFAKYRYDVSKVSIQGNTGLNNERQTQRSHDRNPVMASCFLSRSDEYGNFTETVM